MPDQVQQDYKVRLDSFEGPLDLLLFLVRRSEVDLHDIPIGKITDQYLSLLSHAEKVDVELAGEFLVMAATLVEIKSRTIAPPEAQEEHDGAEVEGSMEDPRADLIRQLLRYQRIRLAAERLDDGRVRFGRQLEARAKSDIDDTLPPDALDLEDVHIMDLAESYERIASAINFDAMGDHRVAVDDTPIALHQADLVDRLTRRAGAPMTLQDIFAGQSPSHRLGLFLATLELVRMHRVDFLQEDEGPIRLSLRPEEDVIRHQEMEQAFEEPQSESDDATSDPDPSPDAAP